MKITRRQLKQIIKEELAKILSEEGPITADTPADPDRGRIDIVPPHQVTSIGSIGGAKAREEEAAARGLRGGARQQSVQRSRAQRTQPITQEPTWYGDVRIDPAQFRSPTGTLASDPDYLSAVTERPDA